MASLYIHPENQTLLWNIIQKSTAFNNLGSNQRSWFKNIIQMFYDRPHDPNITVQHLNRATITYMVDALKTNEPGSPKNEPIYSEPQNRAVAITSAFDQRQKQYETMLQKPNAPQIDFREKIEDEAISNMDELIEQHKKQRETELAEYNPLPGSVPSSNKIKILENIDNNSGSPTSEKNVRFSKVIENIVSKQDDNNQTDLIRTELMDLKQSIQTMQEQMAAINDNLKLLLSSHNRETSETNVFFMENNNA
jgi:hypothetical protein